MTPFGTRTPQDGRIVAGRYRVEELLGVGGSAQVWRAVVVDEIAGDADGMPDVVSGTAGASVKPPDEVAIKLLHPYLLPDASSRARLLDEARAVRELDHPGVVGLRDVVTSENEVALVFDFVPGGSLAARLDRAGRLDPRTAAEIAAALADALDYAHRRGIVHRDVTPGNVLLDADGRPKLADFGIARLLGESRATVTMTGSVVGTLRYMAPEQLAGASPDSRADIYSLGAVLYEMLTGRPPFNARTPVGLVEQQAAEIPDPGPDIPAPLAMIALAMLRRHAQERPPDAGQVATALRDWLAGLAPVMPWLADPARTQRVAAALPAEAAADPVGAPAAAGSIAGSDGAQPEPSSPAPLRGVTRGVPAYDRGQLKDERGRTRPDARRRALTLLLGLAAAILVAGIGLAMMDEAGHGTRAGGSGAPLAQVQVTPSPRATPPPATPVPSVAPTPRPIVPVKAVPKPTAKPKKHHHGGDG